MNMAWLNGLRPLLIKARHAAVRNAPHILMACGTAGSISSVISAAKVSPAALNAVRDAEIEKGEELTFIEKVKAGGKYYIPSILMEILSMGCFWCAHGIDLNRQAVLAGLCSTAEMKLQEYQLKVKDMFGDKGEREVQKALAQDFADQNPPPGNTLIIPGDDEMWCAFEGQYFRGSYLSIKEAENDANHEMIQNMYLSRSELMWLLDPGRRYLKPGWDDGQVGWSVDRLIHLEVDPGFRENHQPVLVVRVKDKNGCLYAPQPGFSKLM